MAAEQTIHLERYAPDAKALVAGAQSLADERKHVQVEPIHLLARALDRDRGVAEVFKKAGADPADVVAEAESQLSKLAKAGAGLAYLSSAMLALLARAEKEYSPHYIVNYLTELAREFNAFYANTQVLDGAKDEGYKLALVEAASHVLKKGLWLLGMPILEKM